MKSGESSIELMVNLWDIGASQISLIPHEVQSLSLGQGFTLWTHAAHTVYGIVQPDGLIPYTKDRGGKDR